MSQDQRSWEEVSTPPPGVQAEEGQPPLGMLANGLPPRGLEETLPSLVYVPGRVGLPPAPQNCHLVLSSQGGDCDSFSTFDVPIFTEEFLDQNKGER